MEDCKETTDFDEFSIYNPSVLERAYINIAYKRKAKKVRLVDIANPSRDDPRGTII